VTARIRTGTASWTDPGFVADWYPPGLPAGERLAWYARRFDLVEVNASFYAVPARAIVERWCRLTPDGFTFDVKLHRLLSGHRAPPESLPRPLRHLPAEEQRVALAHWILQETEPLRSAGKLGAYLLQLPPSFAPFSRRLEELDPLLAVFRGQRLAVELRHRDWLDADRIGETARFFSRRGISFVGVDAPRTAHPGVMPPVDPPTGSPLGYIRAHGRNAEGFVRGRSVAERFDHRYTPAELEEIAERALALAQRTEEVHVIFNNNRSSYAPEAALSFRRLVEGAGRARGTLERGKTGRSQEHAPAEGTLAPRARTVG
jgi:uncharacterized protein YecE (DUF72 family)